MFTANSELHDELNGMNEELERIAMAQKEAMTRQEVLDTRFTVLESLVLNMSATNELTTPERNGNYGNFSIPLFHYNMHHLKLKIRES